MGSFRKVNSVTVPFGKVHLYESYILNTPAAAIAGYPSAPMVSELADAEDGRTKERVESLGEEGLKKLGERLEKAVAHNERPTPDEMLTAVPIPDHSKVMPVPLLAIHGGGASPLAPRKGSGVGVEPELAKSILADLTASSKASGGERLWVEWDHIESSFIVVRAGFDTTAMPEPLRLYLPLLLELAFKMPAALDDGTYLPKDEFIEALKDDTVESNAWFGLEWGRLSAGLLSFSIKTEGGDAGFASALTWLRRALHLTTLAHPQYVRMSAKKMASTMTANFRSGDHVADCVRNAIEMEPASNDVATAPFTQQPFLARLLARLESGPEGVAHVMSQLEACRAALVRPDRLQVFVQGRLPALTSPYEPLVHALLDPPGAARVVPPPPPLVPAAAEDKDGEDGEDGEGSVASSAKADVDPALGQVAAEAAASTAAIAALDAAPLPVGVTSKAAARFLATGATAVGVVAGLGAIENSFLHLTSPGVAPYDEDYAALRLMIEHLTATEGDFWTKLRGAGLTYGSWIMPRLDARRIIFSLYRCTDLPAAYAASKQIIVDYATGASTINDVELAGAQSSLAYSLISQCGTKQKAAQDAQIKAYQGAEVDHSRWLLAQVGSVTAEMMIHALRKYLVPLFDSEATVAVTCPPSKAEEIASKLEEAHGCTVRVVAEEKLAELGSFVAGVAAPPPAPKPTKSTKRPGASAFGFAKQFGKCECPKCLPADAKPQKQ